MSVPLKAEGDAGMSTLTQSRSNTGVLSPDAEVLFTQWRTHGDRQARDLLIERFLPLAHRLARRYTNIGEPYEDLFQIASLGLVKAVERFEPERGFAFTTFAVPTIVGELKRYFRDSSWALHVDRGAKERARQITDAQHEMQARTGRTPTIRQLAQYMERSEEQILDGLQTAAAYEAISLDAPAKSDDEDTVSRIELLGERDERLDRVDDAATLFAAARHLPRRERQVLYLRFGEDLPQTEIANRVGVSQMHVSRLLRSALVRLRELTDDGPSTSG
jgi:RNA polymerase sigma-B factor